METSLDHGDQKSSNVFSAHRIIIRNRDSFDLTRNGVIQLVH